MSKDNYDTFGEITLSYYNFDKNYSLKIKKNHEVIIILPKSLSIQTLHQFIYTKIKFSVKNF